MKLRMVNGSHSALAYLGCMAGLPTVDRAVGEPALRRFIETLMRDEIEPTLPALPGLDLADYRARLLRRFANPALQHQTRQIAMDGSQKLPPRLLGTVRDRLQRGQPIDGLALAVAAWVHHLRGVDEAGRAYEIDDPLAPALARQLALADAASQALGASTAWAVVARRGGHPSTEASARDLRRMKAFCAFAPVFGELGGDARFVSAVARYAQALREQGVLKVLDVRP
jgi:fructuronate reductase